MPEEGEKRQQAAGGARPGSTALTAKVNTESTQCNAMQCNAMQCSDQHSWTIGVSWAIQLDSDQTTLSLRSVSAGRNRQKLPKNGHRDAPGKRAGLMGIRNDGVGRRDG